MNKTLNTEKNILNIIKFGAIIPILLFSIFITYFLINQKNIELKNELIDMKNDFISKNKENVKNEVIRVTSAIEYEKENSKKKSQLLLKNRVYEAHRIAMDIYKEEAHHINKEISYKKHTFNLIKTILRGNTFNNKKIKIFIKDKKGVNLLEPSEKSLLKNPTDYSLKLRATIKNKSEIFDTYYEYKSKKATQAYKKIVFYKYFQPLDALIGIEGYVEELNKITQNKLLKKIRHIKFDKNRYIFILNSKGTYLSHLEKEKINSNGMEFINKKGKYFVKEIITFAKKENEGFFSYIETLKQVKSSKNRKKISFIKYDEKWDWIVGAGFYLDELDIQIKNKEKILIKKYDENILNILILSIFITIILLIISFYISKIISNKFNRYKDEINRESKKALEKEKLLIQQSKMATMGEMIGNIAHQWKQPLNLISMSNNLLKLNQDTKDFVKEIEIDKAIEDINTSIKYLSTTIDDFRDFFKPEKEKSYFNINEIFKKADKLINNQFKNNDIEIITKLEEVEMYGYPNELLQVLINLIRNAKDELVKLPRNNEKFLFINIFKEEDSLIIKIKDNANGIPNNIKNKIFDAYFTTKEDDKGTGIGLYMSKQIIEGMNGEIDANTVSYTYINTKYKGAEFIIKLPIEKKST